MRILCIVLGQVKGDSLNRYAMITRCDRPLNLTCHQLVAQPASSCALVRVCLLYGTLCVYLAYTEPLLLIHWRFGRGRLGHGYSQGSEGLACVIPCIVMAANSVAVIPDSAFDRRHGARGLRRAHSDPWICLTPVLALSFCPSSTFSPILPATQGTPLCVPNVFSTRESSSPS